jgi:hypothetical protein
MTPRTTIAGTAAIIATRATIAFATTISSTATGLATWAEVAKLAGEFGVERIIEADCNRTIAGSYGLCRAYGSRAGTRCGRSRT